MEALYKFSAYNTEALYGWGDEKEADAYCDFLNRNREINTYSFEEITDEEKIERLASGGVGVNLAEALQQIEDEDITAAQMARNAREY